MYSSEFQIIWRLARQHSYSALEAQIRKIDLAAAATKVKWRGFHTLSNNGGGTVNAFSQLLTSFVDAIG